MKSSGRCPKCSCARLYVVEGVRQPAHDSINQIHPMNVTCAAIPAADVGIGDGNIHRAAIGSFDAWICADCGFTEWYAKDFARAFEKLVRLGRNVHVRVATPSSPYR